MNLYPVDNAVRLLSLIRRITNYPLDSVIFPLYNWTQVSNPDFRFDVKRKNP